MPYVVTEICIGTKDTSCHSACPVDAIHPSPEDSCFDSSEQVYIDPTVCIDCGACEPACPVEAIYFDSEVPRELESSIALNQDYFEQSGS